VGVVAPGSVLAVPLTVAAAVPAAVTMGAELPAGPALPMASAVLRLASAAAVEALAEAAQAAATRASQPGEM